MGRIIRLLLVLSLLVALGTAVGVSKREARISDSHHSQDTVDNDLQRKDYFNEDGTKMEPHYKVEPEDLKYDTKIFGYTPNNGPAMWPGMFPWCGGTNQSPVNLDTTTADSFHQPQLLWWGYSLRPTAMKMDNNGHTVCVKAEWDSPSDVPYHWVSPGQDEYLFDQLHFHWGPDDTAGSEHTLNSETFPLEMHVVHHHRRFRTLKDAAYYFNGIRVVSVLFRISEHNNTNMDEVVGALSSVQLPESSVQLQPFPLSRLVPAFSRLYLTYNGSLTTPPCAETVSWVIRKESSLIGHLQLEEFRNLVNHDGIAIHKNFRPTQPLNGRHVLQIR